MRTVGVTAFRARCARFIAQVDEDGRPITITRHGRPVAVLAPVSAREDGEQRTIGALRGSVLRYDEPFAPAGDSAEWDAASRSRLRGGAAAFDEAAEPAERGA